MIPSYYTEIMKDDEFWMTKDGRIIHVDVMSQSHLLNTVRMLEQDALYWADSLLYEDEEPWVQNEDEARVWLADQPMYQAMRNRIKWWAYIWTPISNSIYKWRNR